MALTQEQAAEMVAMYRSGDTSVSALAEAYDVSETTVRNHLKKAEVETRPEPAGESDADLGIGETLSMEQILAHPGLAELVDQAVKARLAQMGSQAATEVVPATGSAAFDAFLAKFDHMLEVQHQQQPGYIKPLSAAEMDRRAASSIEMKALIQRFRGENVWPHYLLGDRFYGPSASGPVLYEAGQEIRTFLPPSDHFKPLNEAAALIYQAYKGWVGEVVEVADLLAQALLDAKTGAVPMVGPEVKGVESDVQLVDAPRRDVSPKRVLGTITPEVHGKAMPAQPGVSREPLGPVFVD